MHAALHKIQRQNGSDISTTQPKKKKEKPLARVGPQAGSHRTTMTTAKSGEITYRT